MRSVEFGLAPHLLGRFDSDHVPTEPHGDGVGEEARARAQIEHRESGGSCQVARQGGSPGAQGLQRHRSRGFVGPSSRPVVVHHAVKGYTIKSMQPEKLGKASALARAVNAGARAFYATAKTRSLTYPRLYWLARRRPNSAPGTFHFPFGNVHYVDAGTLPLMYFEIFVERVYEVAGLHEAANIFDCGANIGLSTIWFKQRYPGARLTAFEADPAIARVLALNVRQLGLASVEVVSAAVSDQSGSLTFRSDGAIGGRVTKGTGITVDSVRLSDYIREPVDLLKLDIEGSEFSLIADLCATQKIELVSHIVCEVHGRGEQPAVMGELWANLARAGFHLAVRWAKSADATDIRSPTPFPSLATGWFVFHLYAWRAGT